MSATTHAAHNQYNGKTIFVSLDNSAHVDLDSRSLSTSFPKQNTTSCCSGTKPVLPLHIVSNARACDLITPSTTDS